MTTTSGMLPSADRSGLSPAYALTAPGATMAAMSAGGVFGIDDPA
jgi:hypothetical protein